MAILRAKLTQKKMQEREEEQKQLRGEQSSGEWGSQIRSYVVHPYKMVKDHRTKYETAQVDDVLDGDIGGFVEAWLRKSKK
jgi:peptide chain release factor 2